MTEFRVYFHHRSRANFSVFTRPRHRPQTSTFDPLDLFDSVIPFPAVLCVCENQPKEMIRKYPLDHNPTLTLFSFRNA